MKSNKKKAALSKLKQLKEKYDGTVFNSIKVLEILDTKIWGNHRACKCECASCGYKFTHSFTHVKSGKPSICNKCRPKRVGKKHILPNLQAIKNRVLKYYKQGAKKRNYSWELPDALALTLMEKPCHYCGDSFSNNTIQHSQVWPHNGIDRMINTVGYTVKNTVPCCKHCNTIKMTLDYKPFLEKIEKIYRYRIMK